MLGVWRKVPESDARSLEEDAGMRCSECARGLQYVPRPVGHCAVDVVLRGQERRTGNEARGDDTTSGVMPLNDP